MKKSFSLFALTLLFCSSSFASHPTAGEIASSSQHEIRSEAASKISVKENELQNQGSN